MKKFAVLALVLLVAGSAIAAPNTTKPNGPLNLYIDAAGVGTIVNDGAVAFSFDGYTIASAGGNIVGAPTGIFDNTLAALGVFNMTVGLPNPADALAWTELSQTAGNYTEATLGLAATLQPGGFIPLGASFPDGSQADLTLTYVNSAVGGSYEGLVIPEPATLSMLALGGLAMLRRRR